MSIDPSDMYDGTDDKPTCICDGNTGIVNPACPCIPRVPDRAEWAREADYLEAILPLNESTDKLRAAVQRAIDERMVPCMDNDCTDSHILYHEARRNDGD